MLRLDRFVEPDHRECRRRAGGTGTVGNTTSPMAAGSAPGSGTPGTFMTVSGNLAFQSGALYLVQLNPTTASFANVTGTATLGGATVNAIFPAALVSKQYTILNAAGGVSGTFGSLVNTNLPANFTTSLSYDANHAYLNLTLNFTPPRPPNFGGGLNINQQNVANALINFFNTTGGIPLVFGALTPAGLTQASGEVATGSQQTTFNAMNQFMGLMTDPFIAGRGDPVSAAASAGAIGLCRTGQAALRCSARRLCRDLSPRRRSWPIRSRSAGACGRRAYGGSQTTDGNAALGSNNTTSRIVRHRGRRRLSVLAVSRWQALRWPAAAPTSALRTVLAPAAPTCSRPAPSSGTMSGAAYLSGALAYGWQDITTDRTVTVAGIDQLRAQFNANAWSGPRRGRLSFCQPVDGGIGITPYAAGQFTTFDLPAYAEQAVVGANTFALAYGSKSVTATRSELGLRTDKSFAMQDGIFTLRGRAAWAHDFNPDRGHRRDVPDAAGRILRRQWRGAGARLLRSSPPPPK